MTNNLPEIWKQTRDLPPVQLALIDQLFSEIEHVNQKLNFENTQTFLNYEFKFDSPKSNYYQPRWFQNGNIQ
jgi:hypothetical protein